MRCGSFSFCRRELRVVCTDLRSALSAMRGGVRNLSNSRSNGVTFEE